MRQKAKQKINLSNSNWLAAGRLAPAGCWPALQRASAALAPRAAAPGRWPPAARASRRLGARLDAARRPPAARALPPATGHLLLAARRARLALDAPVLAGAPWSPSAAVLRALPSGLAMRRRRRSSELAMRDGCGTG